MPRNSECFGCYRKFASFSAMLIHLESGSCASATDIDKVDNLAFECYQHSKYSTGIDDDFPYFCPSCEREFQTVSGLLQHSETVPNCQDHVRYPGCLGKLENFMRSRIPP